MSQEVKAGIVVLIFGAAIIGSVIYSDYKICGEYFPEISRFACIVSSKTKVLGK